MRLGKRKPPANAAIVPPGRGEGVSLSVSGGARIPARVVESDPRSLLIAITVPTRPLSAAQLDDLVLEYNSPRGRVRLQGIFELENPGDPDLLRLHEPGSVEVLQERRYVRIQSARPVTVYGGSDHGQLESYTVDISGGGFLLAGTASLALKDEVTFRLSLATGTTPITGGGRVVRIDSMGRRAIAFESISELDRRRLIRFIFECQRAERQRGLKEEGNGRS